MTDYRYRFNPELYTAKHEAEVCAIWIAAVLLAALGLLWWWLR